MTLVQRLDHTALGAPRRVLGFLCALVALAFLVPTSAVAAEVTFADRNLEAAVRSQLGIESPTPVDSDDMLLLTHLTADRSGISSLDGLQSASNLVHLSVIGNEIRDLTPLSGLTALQTLRLGVSDALWHPLDPGAGNPVSDLTPLANLTSLRELSFGYCQVTDISVVSNLTNLTMLRFSNNRVRSIEPTRGLESIDFLVFSSNYVSDISPVATLPNLRSLICSRNQIRDLTPLQNLGSLVGIRLAGNQITDIGPLVANPNIGYDFETGTGNWTSIVLENNWLDLDSAEVSSDISTLLSRGVRLTYEPQNFADVVSGTNVTVVTGDMVVTFAEVTSPGDLRVTAYAPRNTAPSTTLLPDMYFNIECTATFTGMARITLTVPVAYKGDISTLQVYHWKDDQLEVFEPIVDLEARALTFETSSFSDFGVGEPQDAPPTVSTPASSPWSLVVLAFLTLGAGSVARSRLRMS